MTKHKKRPWRYMLNTEELVLATKLRLPAKELIRRKLLEEEADRLLKRGKGRRP
jgi:hypothetical protein